MEVTSVEEPIIAVRISQYPEDKKPEFLILGRSNVGKSSFINTVINRKNLARTSSKPGKTQTLNFYQVNKEFYIVDVPGYGYAATNKKQIEKFGIMIEEYLKKRVNLKHIFLLIDYRHKPTEDDILMYKFLKYYNLPVTIVCTKYDKVNRSLREKQDDLIKKTLEPALGDEIINFSSVTKIGKERIYEIIENIIAKTA
jgi:GTP-binding protein